MRVTTRAKTIAAAVAAGTLVLTGSSAALATGWGSGQGGGGSAGQGASNGNASASASSDHECEEGAGHAGEQAGNGNGNGKGRGGQGQAERGQGNGSQGNRGQGHADGAGSEATGELGSLTEEQQAQMIFMAEEEKMAGDLYEVFYDMYGVRVFTNIAASEDRHTDAVRNLLDAYGLADPTVGMAVGEFTLPEVQSLYDDLFAQGSESLEAALEVGVLVEETDIADLQEAVDGLDAPRAVAVYENLLAGSENHLRAFSR